MRTTLSGKTQERVRLLKHEGYHEVHTAPMVLMKGRDGEFVVVDASGRAWSCKSPQR